MSRDMGINYKYSDGSESCALIDAYPDTCPFCKRGVEFIKHHAYADDFRSDIQTILQCPRNECRRYVMAVYTFSLPGTEGLDGCPDSYILDEILPEESVSKRDFSDEIEQVSPGFSEIYNQAYAAEQLQLDQISGAGYRKALEFLIKDFACREDADHEEQIRAEFLAKCIDKYIDDQRIRDCAKRATWLGNDQTHYTRRWTDKDIKDLKILIDLTVFWVSSVLLTRKYVVDMP